MSTTVEDLLRHAKDIAFVAEEPPARDLPSFIDQLNCAATNFNVAGISGYENLEDAAVLLTEAYETADEQERGVLLSRAEKRLTHVWDMTQEYRTML
ncbi:hypothetical protein ABT324_28085 [Saccharopolyspora sp. NPDC000359]|uniref:hypothetical protein n=1 Tax=Saccharopolyspora sp. NPDC000359 TaxID=3154251 RepID=UPI00331F20F4